MKSIVSFIVALIVTTATAYAQVNPLDLQAIRNWVNDQAYEVTLVSEVTDGPLLIGDNEVPMPSYRAYKHIEVTHRVNINISTNSHEVVYFSNSIAHEQYMAQNGTNYRQLAWTYLQSHLSPAKISTLQPTESAAIFAPKLPNGVVDWHNRVKIMLRDNGDAAAVYVFNYNGPLYTGSIPTTIVQAKTMCTTYVLNTYQQPVVIAFPTLLATNDLIMVQDNLGYWQPVWRIFTTVSCDEDNEGYYVYVNAVDGSVFDDRDQWLGGTGESNPKFGKQVGLRVMVDGKLIRTSKNTDVPIGWLKTLATTHKLSAKAGEKAFWMDGKRIALPSKVVAKAGTLYLPWQALRSLPGVKCSYDAKLNRLDITTTPAVKKAK